MVTSMTGFASKTKEMVYGLLLWEIRSVNHRYLEINLRLPDSLRHLEMEFRSLIQNKIKRGKVEAFLKLIPGASVPFELVANEALIKQISEATQVVANYFPKGTVNSLEVLNWPGVLEKKQTHLDTLTRHALDLLEETVFQLHAVRSREGDGLVKFIQGRLTLMQKEIKTIESRAPLVKEQMREKIINRFNELSLQLNSERLEQELLLLLQKIDVAEELQRLCAHIDETHRVLAEEEVIGRRLDFLMQEFNREANTLGSKSSDFEITKAVVELKVQIEQTREQVQNIE